MGWVRAEMACMLAVCRVPVTAVVVLGEGQGGCAVVARVTVAAAYAGRPKQRCGRAGRYGQSAAAAVPGDAG